MGDLPEGLRGRILALALSFTVLAALWIGIAAPLTAWYAERAETIDRQTILTRRMAQIAADLPALRAQAAVTQTAVPVTVLDGTTDAVAGAALQQRLQQIASGLGATLASTELLSGDPAGAYRRIGIRIAVTSSWAVIVRLLDAIAGDTPRLLVNDLQIQAMRASLTDADPTLNVTMVVFGFRSGPAQPVPQR
jgi:general secretion pathway protein M